MSNPLSRAVLSIVAPLFCVTVAAAGPPVRKVTPKAPPKPASTDDAKSLARTAPPASRYPNAQKATLLDLADIEVRANGTTKTRTRQAIKVFTPLGRDQESEVRIPFNSAFETVKLIRARTIRPDGTVLPVRPADVRVAQASEYDDAKFLSISMPGVQPGCIIDFEYVTDQTTPQMPGHFWTQWYFQGGIDPVLLTRLTVTAPKEMKIRRLLRNATVEPTSRTSSDGKRVVLTWQQKNVAPFDLEPMMPPVERMLPKLTLSTIPGWDRIGAWYANLARGRETITPEIQKLADRLTAGKTTPEEKAKAIFYHVQDKTRYVAIELGISAYQPRPATRTLVNEYGDCKDMATLLVGLLRAVGITAHPVLLDAGSKFPVEDELPAPSAFNHAICVAEIDGKKYWLDATAQVCPWGEIPAADRGCQVLVIRGNSGTFETIPEATPEQAESSLVARLTLAPDGSATGTVTIDGTGDNAMSLRASLLYATRDRIKPLLEQIVAPIGANPRVSRYDLPNAADRDAPMKMTVDVTFPTWAAVSGNLLLFKARPDQTAGTLSSPFTQDERTHPIYQGGARRQSSTLELTLPEGYSLLSNPGPVALEGPLGSYVRTVEQKGRQLTIRILNDDHTARVPASGYDDVRGYVASFLKAFGESVILKKD